MGGLKSANHTGIMVVKSKLNPLICAVRCFEDIGKLEYKAQCLEITADALSKDLHHYFANNTTFQVANMEEFLFLFLNAEGCDRTIVINVLSSVTKEEFGEMTQVNWSNVIINKL